MKFMPLPLSGAHIIIPEPRKDKRGLFARIFCADELKQIGHTKNIVQVNHSGTVKKGAVRGMHFQYSPKAEIKIIKCIRGAVFDVIVDIRLGSSTFLQWHGENLTSENMKMMYVPEGFAHGFQVLEENSELLYFHTEYYSPEHEGAVRHDDPMIGIDWPVGVTEVSERDKTHPLLNDDFAGVEI
ncbi:MAG: dTDP-4-dehydrorhamnose 3,5-epimerase [Desulfobacteraceae bacterium]|jgi:dTDP-4-dehydrorhamnose 3,5-epimerase|nr:dTDP-4-dehydrorhamnose 3,5-epimerase [Desulfobacteraceae bacterium]